jgi:uncharacterized membrane protein (DUF106 family)
MGRTAEKVTNLVEEEPGMDDAIESVLERARDNGGAVEWSDVRDDITSGQWGRLIERGILVDDDDGFRLADADDVEDALSDDDVDAADEDDDGGWRTIDKLAAVSAVGMILGYNFNPIRDTIGTTLDLVLGPVTSALPFYGVVLVAAVLTGVASVLVQGQMMDYSGMDGHKEKMEELKERRKTAQEEDDQEALEQINQEQQELVMEQFGNFASNFRPMVWTMAVSIPIFLWMYWQLGTDPAVANQTMVMPMLGEMGWRESALAVVPFPAWIVWYFLCSMSLSQLLRKALNIQTTPG